MTDQINLPADNFPAASIDPPVALSTEQAGNPQPAIQPSNKRRSLTLLYEIAETVALAAIIWLSVNFTTARFVVEGSSMEPTFYTGQMLIVNRLAYKFGTPQRGDVIVFEYPGNIADDYIKRIIGVPGDTIVIEDGKVYVNGIALDESYLSGPQTNPGEKNRWTVQPDTYFVMGDNRLHSSDSRFWTSLTLTSEHIIGKVWLSYWPPPRWGFIMDVQYSTNVP